MSGILKSSVRAFCIGFFSVIGVLLGFIALFSFISAMSSGTTPTITSTYTQEILPNANGVRVVEKKEAPVILQINVRGAIGMADFDEKSVRQQLIESREKDFKNDRVKAILLNIDSPGGTVVDSDGIYRALLDYKQKYKVPVYAYVDGLCASGAMYIASAADKIYASDVSLIGSIGVVLTPFVNVSQALEKIGITSLTLSAGKDKDIMNPLRPWKPDEQAPLVDITKYYYHNFVEIVAKARPHVDAQKLIEVYGANVYPAKEAEAIGLIDKHGVSLSETLKALLHEVGIEGDFYQFVQLEKGKWISELFSMQSPLFTGVFKHKLDLGINMDAGQQGRFLYLYQPEN